MFIETAMTNAKLQNEEMQTNEFRRPAAAKHWPQLAQRELVGRVVLSSPFARSERLSTLLTYVCDMTLKGREAELNEQKIGQAVFGRAPDYDSAADGIVRTQASRLRQRLDSYFQQEGVDEPIRIVIPRGGYVPQFQARVETLPLPAEDAVMVPPGHAAVLPEPQRHFLLQWLTITALLAVATLLAANLAADRSLLWYRLTSAVHPTPSQKLWQMMFIEGRPTLLVTGDAGANIFENITRRPITTEEYSSDSWSKDAAAQTPPGYNWMPLARRTYTPWFSVRFAADLARLPEVGDGKLSVRIARNLRLDELKDSQAILLGGVNYDPWEELFSANRNFYYMFDPAENSVSIVNEHPESGELPTYKWKQSDVGSVLGYSLITLTHNLSGTGRILMLQGSTAQGDETAADFLMDPTRSNPMLSKAIGPDGQLQDFEAVVETKFVAGGSLGSTVAAFRIHPTRR